ncbi:hypothetical protein BEN47_18315 [Hymenobacter lapidarius]|uniref:Uncharacterized protein n=1 Tax=Hymenobacter lapidarius TaxID=1908237 RepID=A0A1G1SVQ9_9BACT|nr:hypothetical protein [Hymenobacter lapidarius]OGX82713.1 hypothetical protein BEN47_18315 [Hymenobacter lapidarius]
MSTSVLGERLTQLRAVMVAKSLAPDNWSLTRVAQEIGIPLAALIELEDTGHGSAEVLAAVLRCYQDRDVDVAWVLAPDNADIPLHGSRGTVPDEKRPPLSPPLADLRQLLPPLLAALAAGPTLPPEALHARVTQLRQVALDVLNHLVPPRRVGRTEADLRAWHKFFPPVPAQSTGWHAVGLFTVPYHYVDAGAFLPRCGEDVPYRAYNPVLEEVPNSDKCGTCRSRVDEMSSSFAQPQTENGP